MLYSKVTPEQKRIRFRELLASGTIQQFPGAFNPLSARMIEEKGFAGVYISGAVLANDLGLPDIGLTTLKDMEKFGIISDKKESALAKKYMSDLKIKTSSDKQLVKNLSGGNQQKVVLSKWLFTDPDVLILDEPTRGIDVGAKYEIYTIVNRLVAAGKAVVVISSELPELLGICDRIYALSAGRLTGELPVHEAKQESLMELMTKEKELVA